MDVLQLEVVAEDRVAVELVDLEVEEMVTADKELAVRLPMEPAVEAGEQVQYPPLVHILVATEETAL